MAVTVDYPGVYIEEVTPGAPIDGVGTSTASFMGPWQYGEPNKPEKLFSWDDFLRKFSDPTDPSKPLAPADNDYLYYAVRGFFQNGGKVCYVTRVSNAKADSAELDDSGSPAQKAIQLVARAAKRNNPDITVTVGHVSATTTNLFQINGATLRTDARKGDTAITVAPLTAAEKFRPTDVITINTAAQLEERVVTRVDGEIIRFAIPLESTSGHIVGTAIKLANPTVETRVLRMEDSPGMANLTAGSVIKLSGSNIPANSPVYATVKSISLDVTPSNVRTWRVSLQNKLDASFDLTNAVVAVNSQEFTLTITQGATSQSYTNLSMNLSHPRYFANIINSDPNGLVYAYPPEIRNTTSVPNNLPKVIPSVSPPGSPVPLTGGSSERRDTIGISDYQRVLDKLARIDDINIVCAPGVIEVQGILVDHCETITKDRFAVLDSRLGSPISNTGSVVEQMASVQGNNGGFAALYYPWIRVSAAVGNSSLLVPPSGHVAGIFARTDNNRGVHKAPAGIEATINGALGVERLLTDSEQGDLNKSYGVNVIRVFQSGGRPVVWGARTTATQSNKNWQYINVRRLFLFLEESIQESIQWAVFEPSNRSLWGKLNRTITAFLTQQWRDGALFGATAKDAFFVRIDEALNPPDQQKLGRLTIEIGVRPVYPAEFIIVRIGIWDGGTTIL